MKNIELSVQLLDKLHTDIVSLNKDRFQVQMEQRYVDEFYERERWNNLSADDVYLIEEHLSKLPLPESLDETVRRFDLMMLKLQIANLLSLSQEKRISRKVNHHC